MRPSFTKLVALHLAAFNVLGIATAHAVTPTAGCPSGAICNPLTSTSIQDFFLNVINIIVVAGSYILVMAIIYTGFLFVTAGGNDAQLTKAKNALFYTVIGGAVILGAWVIATAVANTVTSL